MTHDELWAGANIKISYAAFHLREMGKALSPDDLPDPTYAAIRAMGSPIDSRWQLKFGAHFDAFLATTRSVADVIECCFGADPQLVRTWLRNLPADEQDRRRKFSAEFEASRLAFAALRLSSSRRMTLHRLGYPHFEIAITGRFGAIHVGDAITPIPLTESPTISDRKFPPALARYRQIEPTPADFTIDGEPLFGACHEYLGRAESLISKGSELAEIIHGDSEITQPPDA